MELIVVLLLIMQIVVIGLKKFVGKVLSLLGLWSIHGKESVL